MQELLTKYEAFITTAQAYFGAAVAILVALQPALIAITSLAHAVEVQARNRGWTRVQPVFYWIAKVCGTFAVVDTRNVQRVGGKVFEVLAQIIANWPTKDSKSKAVVDAMRDSSRTLLVLLALGSVLPLQGCGWLKGPVVAAQSACQAGLISAPEVIAEAQVRGVSVSELADAFCKLVDVAAIFTTEAKPSIARAAMLPRNQAVALLRAKGEIE
jgi:hypothetical protein